MRPLLRIHCRLQPQLEISVGKPQVDWWNDVHLQTSEVSRVPPQSWNIIPKETYSSVAMCSPSANLLHHPLPGVFPHPISQLPRRRSLRSNLLPLSPAGGLDQKKIWHQWIGFLESIDWFEGKITGKSHISWENRWFPVDFPLSQPIDWDNLHRKPGFLHHEKIVGLGGL